MPPLVWNEAPAAALAVTPAPVAAVVAPYVAPTAASVFIDAGALARDAQALEVGWRRPWARTDARERTPRWSGATELSLLRGWLPALNPAQRRREFTQFLLVPVLRWEIRPVPSPWFAEVGLGLSVLDRRYRLRQTPQASRWNFEEVVAVGYRLGKGHEVSLRLSHFSNAGLRDPNPGGERLMLRWSMPL